MISGTISKGRGTANRKGCPVQLKNNNLLGIHSRNSFSTESQPYMKCNLSLILSMSNKDSNKANKFQRKLGRVQDQCILVNMCFQVNNNLQYTRYMWFHLHTKNILLDISHKAYLYHLRNNHHHRKLSIFFHIDFCNNHLHTRAHNHILPRDKDLSNSSRQEKMNRFGNLE